MSNGFEPLNFNDNDILSFGDVTYKVDKFQQAVNKSFGYLMGRTLTSELQSSGIHIQSSSRSWTSEDYKNWFSNGVNFEVLNIGSKNWKKGKVKIKFSLEFYVENEIIETDNSNEPKISEEQAILDEIRRLICEK